MRTTEGSILITGAAGFIGSRLAAFLNRQGREDLVLVDDFSRVDKEENLRDLRYLEKVPRTQCFEWLDCQQGLPSFVFHLGARTDTTEFDYEIHRVLNLDYSRQIWTWCTQHRVPLVYASSAATYGGGEQGYEDDHASIHKLQPLNPYGLSKHQFDVWALEQRGHPPFWAGLKFFNVYGPNEYHKGRMASVIWHAYNQILREGKVKLFRSHRPDFQDGEQLRDFIYVEDILRVCVWMQERRPPSGIYNLGTGKARSFNDLVRAAFQALGREPVIEYIDMPEDLRDKYQYFTEAKMGKLRQAGYTAPFFSLEEGVRDYVQQYLVK